MQVNDNSKQCACSELDCLLSTYERGYKRELRGREGERSFINKHTGLALLTGVKLALAEEQNCNLKVSYFGRHRISEQPVPFISDEKWNAIREALALDKEDWETKYQKISRLHFFVIQDVKSSILFDLGSGCGTQLTLKSPPKVISQEREDQNIFLKNLEQFAQKALKQNLETYKKYVEERTYKKPSRRSLENLFKSLSIPMTLDDSDIANIMNRESMNNIKLDVIPSNRLSPRPHLPKTILLNSGEGRLSGQVFANDDKVIISIRKHILAEVD